MSQSLPILVGIMAPNQLPRNLRVLVGRRGHRGRAFLLRQPEVHLHPRGQAELASLFVESFKYRGNHFVIETHIATIVDRVRISVKRGELKADDVSILYFEPKRNAVKIHNMTLDDDGNLRGARILYTGDTDLAADFKDKRLIDNPRGKIYTRAANRNLLTGSACRM